MIIDRGRKLQYVYEGVFHDVFLFQNHVDNQLYNYCNSTWSVWVLPKMFETTWVG